MDQKAAQIDNNNINVVKDVFAIFGIKQPNYSIIFK